MVRHSPQWLRERRLKPPCRRPPEATADCVESASLRIDALGLKESVMLAMKRKIMLGAMRLFAVFTGEKIIVLNIEPREGGYSYVRSPDLPGFAMVLQPGEAATAKSLIDALSDPLTAYLEAEGR